MRRDLVTAFAFVFTAHVAVAIVPQYLKRPHRVVHEEEAPTIRIELPPPPPPPPQEEEDITPQETLQMAPPSLADIPTQVPTNAFTVRQEPPPPSKLNAGKITMPKTNVNIDVSKIFDISELDQKPIATLQVQPDYPYELKKEGVTGEVEVGFVCDAEGHVQRPYVIKSTNHEFDDAAIRAVSQWRFRPGRKGGRAVNTRMSVPVGFTLNE